MSAQAAALVRSWRVGRYTATLTLPNAKRGDVAAAVIEWDEIPQRLTHDEIEQYRAGRNAALAALGFKTLVIDL